MSTDFDYAAAFSRNIGWVTAAEQELLRGKRIAIAGLGGVGGVHLLTLARLGIGAFNLAEFDVFDLANFNRQIGAGMGSIGRPKLDVLLEMARDINPALDIRTFPGGVTSANVDTFLSGVDLYVDGLDFFAFEVRQTTFSACARLGVPAVTAAPMGMGVALINFLPGRMTFEEYFRFEDEPHADRAVRFLLGLSPAMLQRGYLVDRSYVSFAERRGPSTGMACQLCAGVAATEALKILLGRGRVLSAPWGMQFDAYRGKLSRTWRPGGNRNPVQRLAIALARRQLGPSISEVPDQNGATTRPVEQILNLARWAPSGDNTQPWRFEIVNEHHVIVHGFDTRSHCVYDLTGAPSQISIGAMLETFRLAATAHSFYARISRRPEALIENPTFDIRLFHEPGLEASDLVPYIVKRSVQRRPLKTRVLTNGEKRTLERGIPSEFEILWLEDLRVRWEMAWLLFANAKIRLTIPEAYEVHRKVIEWKSRYSADRIPDQAVGLDPITTRLMGWVMKDWGRVKFFNRFLGGTLAPRIQLDLIPALACAAHVVLLAPEPPKTTDDYVAAGAAVQRFWLTLTKLGLQQQPEMTPLIFAGYSREGRAFSSTPGASAAASNIANRLERLIGSDQFGRAVWLGRIGAGDPPKARSLRQPLSALMRSASQTAVLQDGESSE